MKVDAFAGNILMGIGFVACMIWYVSSALRTWFGRAELEAAMGSRLIRAVLLVSRSRIASSKSNAMYI